MASVESELALLRNPRLAALATSAWPAWLWSTDASRILWANAVGAALLDAADVNACRALRFDMRHPAAAQIVRLAATLPSAGAPRLERLRGFGAGFGRALTCACARLILPDSVAAVLVAATEPAGPALTLRERVRRLFAGATEALAVFMPDGALLHATEPALAQLGGATSLAALGITTLAAQSLEAGSARGIARSGESTFDVTLERLGESSSRVLVLLLPPPAKPSVPPMGAEHIALAAAPPISETPAPPPQPAAITATAEVAPPSAASPAVEEPAERRHPLRFVWQMDADGRLVVGSDEFIELMGPKTTAGFGRLWSEIAAELKLDPDNQVARAVATHETWSGIVVSWPVDEYDERLPVELSGLPVFDRDRKFRGYRGFGVCRDIERINQLIRARRERSAGRDAATDSSPRPAVASGATPPGVENAPNQEALASPPAAQSPAPPIDNPAAASVPASANVVPFRQNTLPETKSPTLSPVERKAFRDLAQELTARLRGAPDASTGAERTAEASRLEEAAAERAPAPSAPEASLLNAAMSAAQEASSVPAAGAPRHDFDAAADAEEPAMPLISALLLDRIPVGVLIYRGDTLIHANRHFLAWSGYDDLDALNEAGGPNTLFIGPSAGRVAESGDVQSMSIMARGGHTMPVEGRLFIVPWNGASALALILTNGAGENHRKTAEGAVAAAQQEIRALKLIIGATSDGVIEIDRDWQILSATPGAAGLFGCPVSSLTIKSFGELFTPASERAARDYFARIVEGTHTINDTLDVEAHAGDGRVVPLVMTIAQLGGDTFYAVFKDSSARKKGEEELRSARREVQKATSAKAELLAKVSHEIRTPLNAIVGFAEVMMAERFGPVGNERYREYLKDIHDAGTHLVTLLNDLLDLSKIETGRLELAFANVNVNDITQQCVAVMQPQANRARIIIRTALAPGLHRVVADERALRQIVLNLLINSIRFTGPGGQVIISTLLSDNAEVLLRVRDTGIGMSEKDIEAALEPFRQTATAGSWGSGGTGLGLPLTKALAEANHANFSIKSAPDAGTLVEIAFPPSRVVTD